MAVFYGWYVYCWIFSFMSKNENKKNTQHIAFFLFYRICNVLYRPVVLTGTLHNVIHRLWNIQCLFFDWFVELFEWTTTEKWFVSFFPNRMDIYRCSLRCSIEFTQLESHLHYIQRRKSFVSNNPKYIFIQHSVFFLPYTQTDARIKSTALRPKMLFILTITAVYFGFIVKQDPVFSILIWFIAYS